MRCRWLTISLDTYLVTCKRQGCDTLTKIVGFQETDLCLLAGLKINEKGGIFVLRMTEKEGTFVLRSCMLYEPESSSSMLLRGAEAEIALH